MSAPGRSQALIPEHAVRRVVISAPGRSQAPTQGHAARRVAISAPVRRVVQ
jgi:hypothetical protein